LILLIRVVHQFETTPKAFANLSPGLERSDNPGRDTSTVIEPFQSLSEKTIDSEQRISKLPA